MEDEVYQPQPQRMIQPSLYSLPKEMVELLLDATATIERVRHDLKGEVLVTKAEIDKDGQTIYTQSWDAIGEKSMNDKGVRAVVKVLNMYINPESVLTQLDEKEIYKIILGLNYNLNALFYARGKEFELNDNMKGIVIDGVCDIIFFALKKSLNGKFAESLLKSWSIEEQRFPDMKRGSWKDTLMGLSPFQKKGV